MACSGPAKFFSPEFHEQLLGLIEEDRKSVV